MKKTIAKIGLFIILSLLISIAAHAATIQELSPGYNIRPENEPFDLSNEEFSGGYGASGAIIVLQILAGGLLWFAAPVAIIFITMAGIQMTLGGAESEQLEQAKKHLMWSVIGLILIIFSYSAVRAILKFVFTAATPASS